MVQHVTRRHLLRAVAATPALAAPLFARAAGKFPSQPFVILNPSTPGGYLDNLSRAIDPFLAHDLGQSFSIMNLPGGNAMLVHPTPFKADDFTMLNLPSRDYTLMATSAENTMLKSVDDVVKALQADPKSLSIGAQSVSPDNINLA